ncbi:MAG: hypothetical protein U1F54_18420 [Burkholderiales bacterium]
MRPAALLALLAFAHAAHAVPPGYRYVGSRVVSNGNVVYWYWNADHVEIDPSRTSFVAQMYARAAGLGQERPYVAIVRCDIKAYRDVQSRGVYERIEDGEPIDAVWRAGCDKGIALAAAGRAARLGDPTPAPTAPAGPAGIAQSNPAPAAPPSSTKAAAPPPSAPAEPADPRRADACVRFSETRGAAAGDASIANTCAEAVEVTLCYKGASGGPYDCPSPVRGRLGDSLAPGASHVLPEYRRARHRGIQVVACKGAPGSVFPKLDDGKSGCF